jgi:hypothetical protein
MTDEERLQHERLIADIQKVRSEATRKGWWDGVLQSGLVTALLTAIVGTIGGGILVARYQARAHRDELALADSKAFVEAQQHAVERALTLLAQGEYHTRGRYALTRRPFQLKDKEPADAESLRKQRETIINGGNDFDAIWPAQEKTVESLLRQTFPNDTAVAEKWTAAALALDGFISGGRLEYEKYLRNAAVTVDLPPLSDNADAGLRRSISDFTTAVSQAMSRDRLRITGL